MKLFAAIAAVCLAVPAMGQGVRYDHRVATIATNYPPGAQVPVMAIPNAQVTICVDGNCGALAPIFSNQALTVRTSNPMQADGQGNFGFWAAGGTYFYKIVEPSGKVNGIFPFTLGGAGGSSAVTQIIAGENVTISPTNGLGAVTINAAGGPVVEVNGAPLTTPSPVNFEDSASVTFTNPSDGVIQAEASLGIKMQVVPPVDGQFVVIYPNSSSATQPPTGKGSAIVDNNSAVLNFSASISGGIALATWSGFALPSFVNPANVTAIYAVETANYKQGVFNINNPAGESTCTGPGGGGPEFFSSGTTFPQQQFSFLMSGVIGSDIPSITCSAGMQGAGTAFGGSGSLGVASIALVVYYTGTPPPASSTIQIVSPLQYITANNTLGIDTSSPFPGLDLQATTVSGLPQAQVFPNSLYLIKNGANSTDCTTGGGTTAVECYSNGSSWTAFAGGGGGGPTLQTNGASNTSQATLNFVNPSSFNGLTFTFSNPTAGNETFTLGGTLGNAGLANPSTTVNGQTCTLGSTCTISAGGSSVGTAGQLQMVGSTSGSFAASHATDNGTTFAVSEPAAFNDGTGKAGNVGLLAGTAPIAAPTNTVQINAPTAVTAYAVNLPGAQPTTGNTFLSCTAANPAVCTWAAATGSSGFPFTLGSTSIAASSTTTTVAGLTVDGVSPTTFGFVDATSSIQTQLNAKTGTIASGTSALGTSAIASGACATVVTTTATGTASTDAIIWNPNASIKAVTGYVPSTSGGLTIAGFPTTNSVNWDVCNWTAASITPGAVTLNWRVVR